MSQEAIAERLKHAMGLHSETVGMITVSNAINRRMEDRGIRSHEDYLNLLDANPFELQELIEAVIIPETWFFRDDSPYEEIVKFAVKQVSSGAAQPLHILSIPCSTGEEPYSIAMSLDEAHISPSQYRINAFDISQKNIDKALSAKYRKNSFRSSRQDFIARYFQDKGDHYLLSEKITRNVNFNQGNVLDDNFIKVEGVYDIILCRNLLIYFDKPTQAKVFATLHKLLKSDGILILGHAETHHSSGDLFEPLGGGASYIFRKSQEKQKKRQVSSPLSNKTQSNGTRTSGSGIPEKTDIVKPFASVEKKDKRENSTHIDMTEAFKLADAGKLDEAENTCHVTLEEDSSNADAYYLLGIIYDTRGLAGKAEECLRKTIYLEPGHYEALIHLCLMHEQSGDLETANRLRQRARKAQERAEAG